MEEVRIVFADGSELAAEKNGDSYIVDEKPDFPEDFTEVTVSGEEGETVFHDAELIECASVDGRFWFTLREIPRAEAEAVQLRADVDYLLLITE